MGGAARFRRRRGPAPCITCCGNFRQGRSAAVSADGRAGRKSGSLYAYARNGRRGVAASRARNARFPTPWRSAISRICASKTMPESLERRAATGVRLRGAARQAPARSRPGFFPRARRSTPISPKPYAALQTGARDGRAACARKPSTVQWLEERLGRAASLEGARDGALRAPAAMRGTTRARGRTVDLARRTQRFSTAPRSRHGWRAASAGMPPMVTACFCCVRPDRRSACWLGRLGLERARIPHADRHGLIWLERGRLEVEDGCLRFVTAGGGDLAAGSYQIPHQSVSIVLLGPGSSVTHDALRLLARHGCALAAIGEGATRFYTAPPLCSGHVGGGAGAGASVGRSGKPNGGRARDVRDPVRRDRPHPRYRGVARAGRCAHQAQLPARRRPLRRSPGADATTTERIPRPAISPIRRSTTPQRR